MADKDTNKIIIRRMERLQRTIDVVDRDLNTDRKDIQDLIVRVGNLENTLKAFGKGQDNMVTKVGDAVENAVEPITKALDQVKKEPFWKRFIRR